MEILIRSLKEEDIDQVWALMQQLAIFEKYIDKFAITPETVKEKGLEKHPPDFYCLVAEHVTDKKIVGMLVYYFLPYTAQNRPAIYMKELYVDSNYRGMRIGESLMQQLAREARKHNCIQIKWGVAPWNKDGIRFYERLGAKENNEWLNFELDEEAFLKMINEPTLR